MSDEPDDPRSVSASKLNLGCGDDYREDWHNVDIDPEFDPDAVMDVAETPWPWATDAFETILADNVLEHLAPVDRPDVLRECRRVLAPGGEFIVRLPTRTGWDVTHYAVPAYTWPRHPDFRDDWEVVSVSGQRVGPGRLMPERLALWCTRYDLVRCLSQVEVRLK